MYPIHYYENSFQFVNHIPHKPLQVKVKVVGLGIGGSICLSGLAKHGVTTAVGFEKRPATGPRGVTSRYQNASWRAYDMAANLVDEAVLEQLIENRQRIHVQHEDGTEHVLTSAHLVDGLAQTMKFRAWN